MQTTKHNLFTALSTGGELKDIQGNVLMRVVNAVEREDGSNRKWNVAGYDHSGMRETFFITTID